MKASIIFFGLYLMMAWCMPVYAEVVTDGSVGAIKNLSGQMNISQSLGKTEGNNLFHSFKTFNIGSSESATFTGADNLKNVISRVTGGDTSMINGLLKSTVGNANFYFINPAGVTFGASARVDVPADFHVSTANALPFNHGGEFNASLALPNTLSIADPIGFGFVGKQNGDISVVASQLDFKPGTSVSLTAGNLIINASAKLSHQSGGKGGDLQLYAVGNSAAEVKLTHFINKALSGQLTITGSSLDVSGNGGGYLQLNAGDIGMNDSTLYAHNTGNKNASSEQGINIVANNLTVDYGAIRANTLGKGQGGNVTATLSDQFTMTNWSGFGAKVGGQDGLHPAQGNIGNIKVNAKTITADNSVITSVVLPGSTGRGADIDVTANQIILNGLGAIGNFADWGDAGNITIKADEILNSGVIISSAIGYGNSGNITIDTIHLNNGGDIDGSTSGTGHAGNIAINANDILIDGFGSTIKSNANSTEENAGDAGMIAIKAKTLGLSNLGMILSNTKGSGNAGKISINADAIKIDGLGSQISASAYPNSTGKAGSINLDANETLDILNRGLLQAGSDGTKSAGNITLKAKAITLDQGLIFNDTTGVSDDGSVGTILIQGNKLTLSNVSYISAGTTGSGDAGHIAVEVDDTRLDKSTIISSGFITSSGNSGTIAITGNQLSLLNGSSITSYGFEMANAGHINIAETESIDVNNSGILLSASGKGNAGSISITTDKLSLANSSYIDANNSDGEGGSVNLQAKSFSLIDGANISTNTRGLGNAGNITVNADDMIIDRQGNASLTGLSSTSLVQGINNKSGNIAVTVNDKLSLLGGGIISTSTLSDLGDAGAVNIKAGNLLMNGLGESTSSAKIWIPKTDPLNPNATPIVETKVILLPRPISPGISSDNFFSSGHAGTVNVTANNLNITDGGVISSDTLASGDANTVTVTANTLNMTSNGSISSNTSGAGKAGDISVNATTLTMDHAVIKATAEENSTGRAGVITVNATQSLNANHLATINSSTFGRGKAGDVTVIVPNLFLDNNAEISALAGTNSSGQTGNVNVTATNALLVAGQGKISIKNDATVANPSTINAGMITVSSSDISLKDSAITAESTGNVDAGNIFTNFSHQLNMDSSLITTSATDGNGGRVTVNGGKLINLQDSGFLTSVIEATGNGGDINVNAGIMVMKTGVIQANAQSGTGGDIGLNLKALIPSYDSLTKGGPQVVWQPKLPGFNVIQAASTSGVSGAINLASPQFNISGALSGLDASSLVLPVVNRNPCQGAASGSSLVRGGKGGVPITEAKAVFVAPMTVSSSLPDSVSLPQPSRDKPTCAALPQ